MAAVRQASKDHVSTAPEGCRSENADACGYWSCADVAVLRRAGCFRSPASRRRWSTWPGSPQWS